MSLSVPAQKALKNALASKELGEEVAAAIDAQGSGPADEVDAIGSTSDLSAVSGTYADSAEPTGAEVDAAIQASVDEVEARLDVIEAKIDEVIAALKAAALMSS
jgi:hypothetical protein